MVKTLKDTNYQTTKVSPRKKIWVALIGSVVTKFFSQRMPHRELFTIQFCQTFKEDIISSTLWLCQKTEEWILLTLSGIVTLIIKKSKDITRNKSCTLIFLMNADATILSSNFDKENQTVCKKDNRSRPHGFFPENTIQHMKIGGC